MSNDNMGGWLVDAITYQGGTPNLTLGTEGLLVQLVGLVQTNTGETPAAYNPVVAGALVEIARCLNGGDIPAGATTMSEGGLLELIEEQLEAL